LAAGHLDKAEEIFKQGLKHHPSDVMLLHNYGCLLWEGRGEYTRAEGMLHKALKIDPGHSATMQALDDLKADKMSATVRADANAAKLVAQVEVRPPSPDPRTTVSSCFGKAPTQLVLVLLLLLLLLLALVPVLVVPVP
jgi:tetratricopeptide (TPR) repeat protein